MQGAPIPRDELPTDVREILPADCTIRHDEEFLYLYRVDVLIVTLNKRAGAAAMARLLRMAEQSHLTVRSAADLAHTTQPPSCQRLTGDLARGASLPDPTVLGELFALLRQGVEVAQELVKQAQVTRAQSRELIQESRTARIVRQTGHNDLRPTA